MSHSAHNYAHLHDADVIPHIWPSLSLTKNPFKHKIVMLIQDLYYHPLQLYTVSIGVLFENGVRIYL
jgi:hypothetical protein